MWKLEVLSTLPWCLSQWWPGHCRWTQWRRACTPCAHWWHGGSAADARCWCWWRRTRPPCPRTAGTRTHPAGHPRHHWNHQYARSTVSQPTLTPKPFLYSRQSEWLCILPVCKVYCATINSSISTLSIQQLKWVLVCSPSSDRLLHHNQPLNVNLFYMVIKESTNCVFSSQFERSTVLQPLMSTLSIQQWVTGCSLPHSPAGHRGHTCSWRWCHPCSWGGRSHGPGSPLWLGGGSHQHWTLWGRTINK